MNFDILIWYPHNNWNTPQFKISEIGRRIHYKNKWSWWVYFCALYSKYTNSAISRYVRVYYAQSGFFVINHPLVIVVGAVVAGGGTGGGVRRQSFMRGLHAQQKQFTAPCPLVDGLLWKSPIHRGKQSLLWNLRSIVRQTTEN